MIAYLKSNNHHAKCHRERYIPHPHGESAFRKVVSLCEISTGQDDVIKWKHFPRYWPFVWGIHRSPVNSLYKDQWRGALMFALICARINGWVNNREAGDLRRHRAHYDATVMLPIQRTSNVESVPMTKRRHAPLSHRHSDLLMFSWLCRLNHGQCGSDIKWDPGYKWQSSELTRLCLSKMADILQTVFWFIFLNDSCCILIQNVLKFVPSGP